MAELELPATAELAVETLHAVFRDLVDVELTPDDVSGRSSTTAACLAAW